MTGSNHADPGGADALPEELRGLTYDQATPEQVATIRAYVRAQLAAADARSTAADRQRRRAEFLERLNAA